MHRQNITIVHSERHCSGTNTSETLAWVEPNGTDRQLDTKNKQEGAIDLQLTFIADMHLQRALVPGPKVIEALACQARVCGCTQGGDCSIF